MQSKSKNKTDQTYFMINPEDLKYTYIEDLSAVTIKQKSKKLHVKHRVCKNRKQEKTN